MIKDLNLSKESPELLASRLHDKSLFQPGTIRDAKFVPIFWQKGWAGALQRYWRRSYLEIETYVPEDSSKISLKWVLRHITNVYGSIPIGHLTTFKENYDNIK